MTWNASVSSSKFTWTSSATSGNKILSYYANGNKFNAYSSPNNVYMYKASVTYSDYCTTVVPLTKHALTISPVENGTLIVKKGNTTLADGAQVAEGAVITLTAEPNTHYHFSAWTGDVEVSENEGVYTFTMPTSDAIIGVIFEEDTKYRITANVPEGGTYTVKVGDAADVTINAENEGFDAYVGTNITMTSTADDTHKLHSTPFVVKDVDGGSVTVSKSGDNYTFTMPSKAVTITAQYTQTYSITAGTCENGSITKIADKDNIVITRTSSGSKVVVTAEANEHYHLSGMYYVKEGDDTHNDISATDGVYSFSMVASNITVYAEFEEDANVNIIWSVNGNTEVIPASKTYVGEAIVFPTDVEDVLGKKFVGWVSEEYSNETTAPTYANASTVNATEATTYYAVFADCEGTSTDYEYTIKPYENGYLIDGYQNGGRTITAICPTDETKTLEISYTIANFGLQSKKLQMKSGTGYMYNTTDLGSIKSVTLEENNGVFTTYYGTTEKPTSGTSVGSGNGYFRIVASSTGTCSSITVAFTKGSYTYSNYCTTIAAQPSADPYLNIAKNIEVGAEGGNATVTAPMCNIKEEYELTLSVPKNSWISSLSYDGNAVMFTYAANLNNTPRTETVTWTYSSVGAEGIKSDYTGTFTVTQAAAEIYNIIQTIADNTTTKSYVEQGGNVTLTDAGIKSIEITEDIENVNVTYTRNFGTHNLQPWVVPFDYVVPANSDLTFAEIWNAHVDETGKTDYFEYVIVSDGETIPANTPYLVMLKEGSETGEKTFTATSTLYKTEPISIDCATTKHKYTFEGTYADVKLMENNFWYLRNGQMSYTNNLDLELHPYRWHMLMATKSGVAVDPNTLFGNDSQSIKFHNAFGDDLDDADAISEIKTDAVREGAYDLMGRKVTSLVKGNVYIINGKKTYIR